jgi:GSH-dependent disulfide-bond oxidoreductase
MIKFYWNTAPNPAKVALMLEECGLKYQLMPVDTRKGEQHLPAYKAINPNAKVPSIVDGKAVVFDSNAILLYLSHKTGKLAPPANDKARGQALSWLMFIASGIGPYSGQYVHFRNVAPEPKEYALNRYDFEAWRHWNIINDHLARNRYMVGKTYTLVDVALWGWARVIPLVLGADGYARLPHVKRLLDEINARPAAQRAEALKARHAFKTEMDDEAKRAMFPQNERLKKPA